MSTRMSKDEARKLLGGYATGSLSQAEQKALFEAALEDQELFDELSGEQVLKEVLDEPGTRPRLIAALEPPPHRTWLWAIAAAALAIVAALTVVSERKPPPQQIAQVMRAPEPTTAPVAPLPPPPAREAVPLKRKVAPAPAPEPPAELKKEEALADQLQQAKPQADAAPRGFVASAPQAAARLRTENSVVSAPGVFAFNYTVGPDGFLEIVPAAPGFLSVTTENNTAIFPGSSVSAGTPIRIQIPPAATSLVIGFSRTPGITGSPLRRDAATGRETDQDPPNGRILIQLSLTPVTR